MHSSKEYSVTKRLHSKKTRKGQSNNKVKKRKLNKQSIKSVDDWKTWARLPEQENNPLAMSIRNSKISGAILTLVTLYGLSKTRKKVQVQTKHEKTSENTHENKNVIRTKFQEIKNDINKFTNKDYNTEKQIFRKIADIKNSPEYIKIDIDDKVDIDKTIKELKHSLNAKCHSCDSFIKEGCQYHTHRCRWDPIINVCCEVGIR